MTPEIIGVGITIIMAIVGYLLKNKDDVADSRITKLESHQHHHSTQQARDDVKWENQTITNAKVDVNQNETAVLKSQVSSLHNSVDELKQDIKEVNTKLDVLIQRK
jgi:septal ring factor EnvC (AmiA/AmiB activator)